MSLREAIAEASSLRARVKNGENPAADRERRQQAEAIDPTVRTFARETFLPRYANELRSKDAIERMLEKDVLPRIGKLRTRQITRQDIIGIVDTIADRGARSQARKTLAALKRMFQFAIERGAVDDNPCRNVTMKAAAARQRALSEAELRQYVRRLGRTPMSRAMRDVLRIQLLMGSRINEIAGMQWSEIDEDASQWRLPAERSKNRKPNVLPIPPLALAIVKRQPRGTDYVFPGVGGRSALVGSSVTNALARSAGSLRIAKFGTHDVRRTVATGLGALRVARPVQDKILNHVPEGVTAKHYDMHGYIPEARAALELWERHVVAIARAPRKQAENVVPIRKARAGAAS
jgi:integrase